MNEKALATGNEIYLKQPEMSATKLGDTQTYGLISIAAYKTLVDTKTFTYNGIKFKIKIPDSNPMKLDGKELDVTHVISEDGKLELWLLNNPSLPLIMQSAGLPIDLLVKSVK